MHDLNMAVRFACTILALCASRASPAKLLEARVENAPIVFSLDASPGLVDHAFSAIASLSSIVHASPNATRLRFAFVLTIPEASMDDFTAAMCDVVISSVGGAMHEAGGGVPMCARRSLGAFLEAGSDRSCGARPAARLPARVTFVHFPQHARAYPGRVQRVLELLCCSQHRYSVDRPELARSMGNHARFFAYLALLPLGVRRALFLDVDTLVHDDVGPLLGEQLDEQRFIAAAKRCAPKRAAYKPRFKFADPLVAEFGLKSEAQHVNAGVLVMDMERYCAADIVKNLDAVLVRHLRGPPLWRQGNNQPPFTIAAARHTLFVHPSWNVRPGDAKAEQMVAGRQSRYSRKHPKQGYDPCAEMIHTAPKILHAHFKPCDALPARLCPSSKDAEAAKRKELVVKTLKNAILSLLDVDRKDKRPKAPCSCKGAHFTDVVMLDVDPKDLEGGE